MKITPINPSLIEIKISDFKEIKATIKKLHSQGVPIHGLKPKESRAFDDYVVNTSESVHKLSGYLPIEQSESATEYFKSLFEVRNKKVINDFLSSKEGAAQEQDSIELNIEDNYSFDDIPAATTVPSILERTRVNFESEEFKEIPSIIKMGDKPFGSLGNFSMIIGKPKSKKTFFSTLLASIALGGQDESNFITIDLPEDKQRVVLFDTEQSVGHVFQVGNRVMHMTPNYQPGSFEVFSLRAVSIEQRLEAIGEFFETYNNIGLVIIDGVRDLVHEINSEKQASDIANKLLGWTQKYHTHIIVVLHVNKGDDSARGHIGSELLNKAETTVSIKGGKNFSTVRPVVSRNEEFAPFGLGLKKVEVHDQEFIIPFINTDISLNSNGKAGKVTIKPESIPQEAHNEILKKLSLACGKEPIGKTKAKELIKDFAKSQNFEFGNNKAQEILQYYEENQWVLMVDPISGGRKVLKVNPSSIH